MEQRNFLKNAQRSMAVGIFLLLTISSRAQFCTNPTDSIYTLDINGNIHAINLNNATVGATIGTVTGSENSNGMGFSSLNGKFYFFSRSGATTNPKQQFVSFDPSTGLQTTLHAPPATIMSTHKIRSGTVNNLGTGYYTINPNANPVYLYYYNTQTDTWTTITSTWFDNLGHNIGGSTGDIKQLNSGDMAFDGLGNLWILASNTSQYALYRINYPVPTTAVASITVDVIISRRNNPTMSGVSFTGLGFNLQGEMYLATGGSTGTPTNANNNLWRLNTAASSLDSIGKLPNDFGGDMTSCVYPVSVLPVTWVSFTAKEQNGIELTWTANENSSVKGYEVEHSTDGQHWKTLNFVTRSSDKGTSTYYYTDHQPGDNNNFYRIVQVNITGKKTISITRLVSTKPGGKLFIGPNPAKEVLYIYNKDNTTRYRAKIFDRAGQLVYVATLNPDTQTIDIHTLPQGTYLLTLAPSTGESPGSYRFIKW